MFLYYLNPRTYPPHPTLPNSNMVFVVGKMNM